MCICQLLKVMDYHLENEESNYIPTLPLVLVSIQHCCYYREELYLLLFILFEFREKVVMVTYTVSSSLSLFASAWEWRPQVHDVRQLPAADSLPRWRQDHVRGLPERPPHIWWVWCDRCSHSLCVYFIISFLQPKAYM